jgi:hypothetical protein
MPKSSLKYHFLKDLIDGMVFWEGLYADHPENWLWGRLKGYLGQKSVLEVVAAWVYAIEIRRKAHQIRF